MSPTVSKDSTSATPNLTPSSISAATMKFTYANESQLGTSLRRVSMASTIVSSANRSRRIWVNLSKICSSFTLCCPSLEECRTSDILGHIECPVSRLVVRCRWVARGETEGLIEARHHAVLLARDVLRAYRARPQSPGRLDGNRHRFELDLAAKDTATHHPDVHVERIGIVRGGPKNHRTDQPIVAK